MEPLVIFLLFFFLFLMSVVLHELGHAAVAAWCGDTTAKDLGRITLNPIAHIDPFWTVLLPILTTIFAGFPFGGAKPVPVNPLRFRRLRRDDRLVTLAGPAANVIQAGVYAVLYHVACGGITPEEIEAGALASVLLALVYVNILLAVFNLLPIPPLDGSHILASFLPDDIAAAYRRIGFFGILILLVALRTPEMHDYLHAVMSYGFTAVGLDLREAAPGIVKVFRIPGQLLGWGV